MYKSALLLIAGLLLAPGTGWAKTKRDLTYSYRTIWTTSIRLLRADRGYEITDKDKDSGYILFVYPGDGSVKECRASLEMVSTTDVNGFKVVRLMLEIAHQPSYVEIDLLDRLERKLREERGEPPLPRRDEPDKPKQPKEHRKGKDETRPG